MREIRAFNHWTGEQHTVSNFRLKDGDKMFGEMLVTRLCSIAFQKTEIVILLNTNVFM
jgi:hypothetical protein